MEAINLYQISILLLQGIFVATLILFLFRIRSIMGIGLLFTALGLFQFMQVFLSSTVYVAITRNILVSPGSSVLFTASLFAILLIYIKEDATETRKIIYALVIVNIVMSILLQSFSWNIEESSVYNPFNVSTKLFDNNAQVLLVGTLTLFIDSLLIIIIYEFLSKRITYLFFRICLTMLFVVCFDTVCFSLGAFWNFENLGTILYSGILSKGFAAIFYSIVFTFYLAYIERDSSGKDDSNFKDIFYALTYRQKYKIATDEKELILKKAEQAIQLSEIKYQTLARISPVGIFLTRIDGYTTYVNPRWCTISGLSQELATGDGWLDAVHPEDRIKIKNKWSLAYTKGDVSHSEYRFLHPDGTITWVLGQAVPEVNTENEIIGYVGTITDITDIKIYEAKLNQLKEKAEESDRLKSAFLANMSHEIRTPMNGILGFSELLNEPNLTGKERNEYIRIIKSSGKRMLNIINDIVDISKIESGQMTVSFSETKVNELTTSIFDFFKPEATKKGIQFSLTNGLSDKKAIIITDEEKTIRILTNLVKNAIKYTNDGNIELGYTLQTISNSPVLEFFVRDTGIGVPKKRQRAIFERFVQADIADKDAMQGAGLGLSISYAYVEMLKGNIWMESKEGKGSIFYFTLPYDKEQIEDYVVTKRETKTESVIKSKKIKVLIAEDDANSDLLITTAIKGICDVILHAKTGTEAVEICRNNTDIDLVLMDIKLPLMNGHTAAKLIKEFRPTVSIVAQSAYAMEHEKSRYAEFFDDYLTKPILKDVLLGTIKKHTSIA